MNPTVPLSRWKPTTQSVLVGIGNRQFAPFLPDEPLRSWSLGGTDEAIRFEVRAGDHLRFDRTHDGTPKERAEVGAARRYSDGEPVDMSWTLDLQTPAMLTSKWTVLGQVHQDGCVGPPPLALAIVKGNRWQLAIRSPGRQDRYLDVGEVAPSTRVRLRFTGGASGRVTLLLDDRQVVDAAGPVGGPGGGFYPKIGIYRYAAAETVIATYRDLRISSGDMALTDRRDPLTWRGGMARIAASAHSRVSLYDDGKWLTTRAIGQAGFVDIAPPTTPGIHYLSAGGNELVVARGTAADLWPLMDRLSAMTGLAAVQVTDEAVFDLPGTTKPETVIAAYAKPLALIGPHRFRKTAHPSPTSTRIDMYDETGKSCPK